MSDTDAAGDAGADRSALAEMFVAKPEPAPLAPPPPSVVFAVLTANRPPLRSGQVVFGTSAQVTALGADARLATPAEISVSAPSHFPLEG